MNNQICKACGNNFNGDDLDFVYPLNQNKSKWTASCPCCSMFVTGSTREEAISKWNSIDQKFILDFWKKEMQWRKRNYQIHLLNTSSGEYTHAI